LPPSPEDAYSTEVCVCIHKATQYFNYEGWFILYLVRFEIFMAMTMKNCVFWDVTPCGSCKNRRFGGTYGLLHQGDKNWWTRNNASCN
jgi:hypothetical protein